MTESNGSEPASTALLSPRKIVVQLIGFGIGLALLVWCIHGAVTKGDWSLLTRADPALIAGLVGCSIVSLVVNGFIFWITIRPVHPLGARDLQLLNYTGALLNYAPVRLGLVARVAYHLRVDRMSLLLVGGWLTAVGVTLALCLGACVVATMLRPNFDLWWVALLLGQLALGGWLMAALMSHPLVVTHGRGMDRMLRHPTALWGAIGLRLLDIGAFAGRMACAVAILPDLSFTPAQVLLLSFATLALTLNPLGRFGFREAGVAFVAGLLGAGGAELSAEAVEGQMQQLALIESLGEAAVAIPLGALSLFWYRRRWANARGAESAPTRKSDAQPSPPATD